jgi:hypothetical protein
MRCSYHSAGDFREMPIEARAQLTPWRALGARPSEHDEIPRWQVSVEAKSFTGKTLEAVAIHGAFGGAT